MSLDRIQRPNALRVLFLAAQPDEQAVLRGDAVLRELKQALAIERGRGVITIDDESAVRPSDVQRALNQQRPHVLHFHTHGNEKGRLMLERQEGPPPVQVTPEAMAALLRAAGDDVRLVFFGACHSEALAAAAVAVVDFAIGMHGPIEENAAKELTVAFYRALAMGRTVKNAFDQALAMVAMHRLAEEDKPKLWARAGIDPADHVLVDPGGDARSNVTQPPAPHRRPAAVLAVVLATTAAVVGVYIATNTPPRAPPDTTPLGMTLIKGGSFLMGSDEREIGEAHRWCSELEGRECPGELHERERPVRQVTVSSFYLDRTEVANERFADWLNTRHGLCVERDRYVCDAPRCSQRGDENLRACSDGALVIDLAGSGITYTGRYAPRAGFERSPVVQVSRGAAGDYCHARPHGRLPTEAEWEFAARGAAGRRFPWGDDPPRCEGTAFARQTRMACASLPERPLEVGTSAQDRTPEGVTELAGNVAEWVADGFAGAYDECPPPCIDPARLLAYNAPAVARGGSWLESAAMARSAGRGHVRPGDVKQNVGFRCAAPANSKGDER